MKKYFLVGLLFVIALAVSSLCIGQDMTLESCNDVIQKSCTKCHDTGRICHELDESDADWPHIVKEMCEKGNMGPEVEAAVLDCLTKSYNFV